MHNKSQSKLFQFHSMSFGTHVYARYYTAPTLVHASTKATEKYADFNTAQLLLLLFFEEKENSLK